MKGSLEAIKELEMSKRTSKYLFFTNISVGSQTATAVNVGTAIVASVARSGPSWIYPVISYWKALKINNFRFLLNQGSVTKMTRKRKLIVPMRTAKFTQKKQILLAAAGFDQSKERCVCDYFLLNSDFQTSRLWRVIESKNQHFLHFLCKFLTPFLGKCTLLLSYCYILVIDKVQKLFYTALEFLG